MITAETAYLFTVNADVAEEIGLRAWAAHVIVQGMVWVSIGGVFGWLAGFFLGELLVDRQSKWSQELKRQERRRRRRAA